MKGAGRENEERERESCEIGRDAKYSIYLASFSLVCSKTSTASHLTETHTHTHTHTDTHTHVLYDTNVETKKWKIHH